jgi:hypothetical protein
MRDRNLERNIKRVEAFIEHWKQLSQFLERGFQGGMITSEEEGAFLDLKCALAQEHETLMTLLASNSERDERPLKLLNLVPSLEMLKELPEHMPRKISTDWHTSYLGMQALLGKLKGQKAQLAGISSLQVGAKRVFLNPVTMVLVYAAAGYGIYVLAEEWIPKLAQLGQ